VTSPRQILPGTTYLVTRRCSQRQFLLRPSALTNATFLFVLALAARRYGVEVTAFCVMSNHYHLIVTDPKACLPAFSQYLDSLVARALNASLGRWDAFWAQGSYSAVALASPRDIVEKTAYVLANPVAAGLVASGSEWPGLWSDPRCFEGNAIEASRPVRFFRAKGYLPDHVELPLLVPPGFKSADEFRELVAQAAAELEDRARRELAASGRGFLGAKRVLEQRPTSRPYVGDPRRRLNPRVAARDKWKRIEVLTRLIEFVQSYRAALRARRAGRKDVVFPPGTYLMRVAHGVPCAAAS
jgi:REP element-mobilizing transposase RayT